MMMSPKSLMAEYDISRSTVYRMKLLIQQHPERYGRQAVIERPKMTRISAEAFRDAFERRDEIIREVRR